MDEDDPRYYQKLELDRKRIRALSYGFLDIPISPEHAEDIKRKTRQAEERRNEKRPVMPEDGGSSSWDHVSQASQRPFPPSTRSSPGHQISPTSTSARVVTAPRIGHDPETDRQPLHIPTKGGNTAEILAANEWPIVLWSGIEQLFEGIVLLDSGTQDNWISKRVVRANKIPCYEDPDDKSTYKDFSGHLVKSCGLVRTEWFYQNRRMPVTFRITPKEGPFDTLFGYAYLLEANLITFNDKIVSKGVLPLVKATKAPSPGEASYLICVAC
jgi:hypothetical protein